MRSVMRGDFNAEVNKTDFKRQQWKGKLCTYSKMYIPAVHFFWYFLRWFALTSPITEPTKEEALLNYIIKGLTVINKLKFEVLIEVHYSVRDFLKLPYFL